MGDDLRPLLLGESPSKPGDRYYMLPLSGAVARTLCQLAGIPPQEEGSTYGKWTWALYDRFECRNVFDRYRDATPWRPPLARSRVESLLPDLTGRVVVCLGRRPQKALLGALEAGFVPDFHEWRCASPFDGWHVTTRYLADQAGGFCFATVHHPSGLNRSLNDPKVRDRCGATLRRALEMVPVGAPA